LIQTGLVVFYFGCEGCQSVKASYGCVYILIPTYPESLETYITMRLPTVLNVYKQKTPLLGGAYFNIF